MKVEKQLCMKIDLTIKSIIIWVAILESFILVLCSCVLIEYCFNRTANFYQVLCCLLSHVANFTEITNNFCDL